MGYTRKDIIKRVDEILTKGVRYLYCDSIVNLKGRTTDTKELYTEVIVEHLYSKNIIVNNNLKGVKELPRDKSYYTKSHETLVNKRNTGSNRAEENYVKDLFIKNPFKAEIGKPIEYQVPLKNKLKDESVGKIDLITYKDNELFLVEVKANNSNETALKTILEVQTYSQLVKQDKLIKNLTDSKGVKKDITIKNEPQVRKAIIIFEKTRPATEIKDTDRKQLYKLISDLEITVCYAK